MDIVSKANSVRISPKKLRKVADLIRGLNVNKALSSLSHMDEKGAAIILKTLSSAVANADNNEKVDNWIQIYKHISGNKTIPEYTFMDSLIGYSFV
mgnify:CR=1 FL=1